MALRRGVVAYTNTVPMDRNALGRSVTDLSLYSWRKLRMSSMHAGWIQTCPRWRTWTTGMHDQNVSVARYRVSGMEGHGASLSLLNAVG